MSAEAGVGAVLSRVDMCGKLAASALDAYVSILHARARTVSNPALAKTFTDQYQTVELLAAELREALTDLRALAAQAEAGAGLRAAVQEYFAAEQEYADLESITRHDVLPDAAWEAHNALADAAARRESDAYKRLRALAQAQAGGEG